MAIRDFISWLALLGLPTIFGMTAWCVKKCTEFTKQMRILMEAQQKQMARDLARDCKDYLKQGYIEDEDLELWEQNYQKYHALGANGVMDSRRAKLLALPNIPPTQD